MLFHYALAATQDNWFHDTIQDILVAGMDELDSGQPLSAWPACIPLARRATLSTKTGLRDRRADFFAAFAALDQQERNLVRSALTTQNAIPAIFDGVSPWVRLADLPATIAPPTMSLFRFAFGLLTDIGLRDTHYRIIYAHLPVRICPFCGLERLSHPNQPRPDLDHYLVITAYPFAGANLRNLAPMGDRCNKAFKKTSDVIYDPVSGQRERCCDPYQGPTFTISLENSQLLASDDTLRSVPNWFFSLQGNEPDCAPSWKRVFQIERRYADFLGDEYHGWLAHFSQWSVDPRSKVQVHNSASCVAAIDQYIETVLHEDLADANFLRRAVFQMIRSNLAGGPNTQQITEWLLDLVDQFRPAVAA